MFHHRPNPFLAALILVVLVGCSQQQPAEPGAKKTSGSKLAFKNLRAFDVVSGKLALKTTAPGGKVLAGGAAVQGEWDTSKHPDGLVEVTLTDKTGKQVDRALVVVLNNGSEVFFKNGSSGKVEVPPTGYKHQHLRYHWDLGDGAKKIVAILTWDEPGFDLELALGQGTCPHHGTQAAGQHSTTSPITLTHAAPEGQTLGTGQWFTHVRLMNPKDALGKQTPFQIRAYVLK